MFGVFLVKDIFFKRTSFKLPLGQKFPHQKRPLNIANTTGASIQIRANIPMIGKKIPNTQNATITIQIQSCINFIEKPPKIH